MGVVGPIFCLLGLVLMLMADKKSLMQHITVSVWGFILVILGVLFMIESVFSS